MARAGTFINIALTYHVPQLQLGPSIEKFIRELDSQHDLPPNCTLPAIHETFTAALTALCNVLTLKTRFQ